MVCLTQYILRSPSATFDHVGTLLRLARTGDTRRSGPPFAYN